MSASSRLAGFLVFHENADFCDSCLAGRLGLTREQARAAVATLATQMPAIMRGRWICHLCAKRTEVTRALPNRTLAVKGPMQRRAARASGGTR